MNENDIAPVTLSGNEALSLWHEGKEAWNRWVDENRDANVSFSGCNFPEYLDQNSADTHVSFDEFRFPNGHVDFFQTVFGSGTKSFRRTVFGSGGVNFFRSEFGNGHASFSETNFGNGNVSFRESTFGGQNLNFDKCTFAGSKLDMSKMEFGSGGLIAFGSTFGCREMIIDGSSFGEKGVLFANCKFVGRRVFFIGCDFRGPARFLGLAKVSHLEHFSFMGSSFERRFVLSGHGVFGGAIDLRSTKFSHQPSVQDISCTFPRKLASGWKRVHRLLRSTLRKILPSRGYKISLRLASRFWGLFHPPMAAVAIENQKFRRLKELASSNGNHAKALEFHVQEIQSRRGYGSRAWEDLAQFVFWLFGDYGRNWVRPFLWLFGLGTAFALLHWDFRKLTSQFADKDLATTAEASRDFLTALTYSASNMLSFIPTGRTAKQQGEELLFGGTVPDEILLLSGAQSILAVILLFLLGLGLRNLFRV